MTAVLLRVNHLVVIEGGAEASDKMSVSYMQAEHLLKFMSKRDLIWLMGTLNGRSAGQEWASLKEFTSMLKSAEAGKSHGFKTEDELDIAIRSYGDKVKLSIGLSTQELNPKDAKRAAMALLQAAIEAEEEV